MVKILTTSLILFHSNSIYSSMSKEFTPPYIDCKRLLNTSRRTRSVCVYDLKIKVLYYDFFHYSTRTTLYSYNILAKKIESYQTKLLWQSIVEMYRLFFLIDNTFHSITRTNKQYFQALWNLFPSINMATPVLSNGELDTSADDQHLETFSLIWLDTNMNVKETRNTEEKLRSIINHLKKFPDVKQCQEYIEQRSQEDRLVLIVSGRMGQEMVPVIHHLRQVISIYVYCTDKKKNEEWSCKFPKVDFSMTNFDSILWSLVGERCCSWRWWTYL